MELIISKRNRIMSARSVHHRNEHRFNVHCNNIMSHDHLKERICQSDLHVVDKKWLLDLIDKLPFSPLNFNAEGIQS